MQWTLWSLQSSNVCLLRKRHNGFTNLTWWLINPVAAPFSKQETSSVNNCWFQWIMHYRRISQGMLSIVNVHCWKMPVDFDRCKAGMFVFYETLETSRIALITWPCDWIIQLLTDLFSLHFLSKQYDEDYWSSTKDGWLVPADHTTYIFGYHRECFRLWMFTVEKCCSGLYDRCKARTFFYNNQGIFIHNVVSSVSKR